MFADQVHRLGVASVRGHKQKSMTATRSLAGLYRNLGPMDVLCAGISYDDEQKCC